MMNLSIKGLHMPLTDAIKHQVKTKTASMEKSFTHHAYVHVELGRTSKHHKGGPDVYQTEITIDTNGQMYFIRASADDLYRSLDQAVTEMIETMKQGKGKRQTLLRKGRMMLKRMLRKSL